MEKNKLDRLFEDKLSRHGVEPSAEAWQNVQAGLQKKSPMLWVYRVAAAVVLIVLAVWIVRREDTQPNDTRLHAQQQQEVVAPLAQTTPTNPEVIADENQPEEKPEVQDHQPRAQSVKKKLRPQAATSIAQVPVHQPVKEEDVRLPVLEPLRTEAVAEVIVDVQPLDEALHLDTEPIQELPGVKVQITYKAGGPDPLPGQSVEEEKSKLGRLWAKAKEIKPGEVLASVRETKNEFFDSKLN